MVVDWAGSGVISGVLAGRWEGLGEQFGSAMLDVGTWARRLAGQAAGRRTDVEIRLVKW